MGRSHRSRKRIPAEHEPLDVSKILWGSRHTQTRRGSEWNVQRISAPSAAKSYTCPGCVHAIVPGTAHIVAWRADGLMGEEADLAQRRHWHEHCWNIS